MKHTFAGREIEVKTLTVSQVDEVLTAARARMNDEKESPLDIIDLLFNDSLPPEAIISSTGLSAMDITADHDPKEVKNLIDKVRAANPFFVAMTDRLSSQVKKLTETKS